MTATLPPRLHPDRAAMLRQILEWPEDDAPRLVFADYLDEIGEHDRAELIRGQINEWTTYAPVPKNGRFLLWGNQFLVPSAVDRVVVRRGFISEIRLPCSAFMRHAREIFQSHPVTRVVLADCKAVELPGRSGALERGWHWPVGGGRNAIPWGLYDLMPDNPFPTESAALDALSLACVQYGRELAGLRPLSA